MIPVEEVAGILGCSPRRVIQRIRSGEIPGEKVQGDWMVSDDWRAPEPEPETDPITSGWVGQQTSPSEARILAQAEETYWKAQARARQERMLSGELVEKAVLRRVMESTISSIDAVLGPLAISWQGKRLSEADVRQLMHEMRDEIVAAWAGVGVDID